MAKQHVYAPTALLLLLLLPMCAQAGMPDPLPIDPERIYLLNDSVEMRLQAISFFVLGLLFSAGGVKLLWNYLLGEIAWLPRLTYGKALAGVVLWGLLFILVLTMISGARELMTPGAWKKQGSTYKLADSETESGEELIRQRRQRLEKLRTALWHFAATHEGRLPSHGEVSEISDQLWEIPEAGGLRFLYVPAQTVSKAMNLLVYEPELDTEHRWVLLTNGDTVAMNSKQIASLQAKGKRP